MRKSIISIAICLFGGSANATLIFGATEVFDTSTGLDWEFMQPEGFVFYDEIINRFRTDGKRLATAYEVSTLYSDAGLFPLTGYSLYQNYPAGFSVLAPWYNAVSFTYGPTSNVYFITAPDNGAYGYFGDGQLYQGHTNWGAYVTGEAQFFNSYYGIPGKVYGAALVSLNGPAPVFAVPEPASVVLMAIGLAFVAGRRARAARLTSA